MGTEGMGVFRPNYRELSVEEKGSIDAIKNKAGELYDLINDVIQENPSPVGREIALAKTKLEESIMWAVKGITK